MVYTEEITEEEKSLINQLRPRLQDELPTNVTSMSAKDQDLYFVRWLRARDLNLDKATEMLRKTFEWRTERKADQILKLGVDPFLAETFLFSIPGTDKDGHPVLLLPLSEWDARLVINNNKSAEFDDFVVYLFESVMDKIRMENMKRKENESPVTQMFGVIDVSKYPYGQLMNFRAMKKILQMPAIFEANYPGILFKAAFINCPSYFGIFMNMLKPMLGSDTASRLKCYSSIIEWQEDMVDFIDPSILPQRYGGTAQ